MSEEQESDIYLWEQALASGIFKEEREIENDFSVNPIQPDTAGKDQDQPEPVWVDNKDAFKELEDLKRRIYDLEVKLLNKLGKWSEDPKEEGEDTKEFNKEKESVNKLKKVYDKLSSEYGLENESPKYGLVMKNERKIKK